MVGDDVKEQMEDIVVTITSDIKFRTNGEQDNEQVTRFVERQAKQFIECLDEHGELSAWSKPREVASGVVYAAVQALELPVSMRTVAVNAKVSEVTVGTYYSLVHATLWLSSKHMDDVNEESSFVIDEADVENTILASKPELLTEYLEYNNHVKP